MDTERPSPRYADLDQWDPADTLDAMIEGQFAAVAAVRAVRPALEAAALAMEARLRHRGRLVYSGAGTSGPPGGPGRRRTDADVQLAARAARAADGWGSRCASTVYRIAVSASGTTPFTLACLREARQYGALTIGVANNRGAPILDECDHPIWLDTGAEPIAGSTRLKAGTAQKVTLNLLSSLLMILLGRVYGGLMVDVQVGNEKLVRRSEDMLIRLTGRTRDEVRDALRRAHGSVKLAVMLLHGCDLELATTLLDRAGGRLRTALSLIGQGRSDST